MAERADKEVHVSTDKELHVVTGSDIVNKVDAIDKKVDRLLAFYEKDEKQRQKHEKQIDHLQKWVYVFGIPLLSLASIALGVDFVSTLL